LDSPEEQEQKLEAQKFTQLGFPAEVNVMQLSRRLKHTLKAPRFWQSGRQRLPPNDFVLRCRATAASPLPSAGATVLTLAAAHKADRFDAAAPQPPQRRERSPEASTARKQASDCSGARRGATQQTPPPPRQQQQRLGRTALFGSALGYERLDAEDLHCSGIPALGAPLHTPCAASSAHLMTEE